MVSVVCRLSDSEEAEGAPRAGAGRGAQQARAPARRARGGSRRRGRVSRGAKVVDVVDLTAASEEVEVAPRAGAGRGPPQARAPRAARVQQRLR